MYRSVMQNALCEMWWCDVRCGVMRGVACGCVRWSGETLSVVWSCDVCAMRQWCGVRCGSVAFDVHRGPVMRDTMV